MSATPQPPLHPGSDRASWRTVTVASALRLLTPERDLFYLVRPDTEPLLFDVREAASSAGRRVPAVLDSAYFDGAPAERLRAVAVFLADIGAIHATAPQAELPNAPAINPDRVWWRE